MRVYCLSVLFLVSAAIAADLRRKAIRREMIEMDIAIRNLASTIAMAEHRLLDESLERLAVWQIQDHPELAAAFREVLADWRARGALQHAEKLQKEVVSLRSFVATRKSNFRAEDWQHLLEGYNRILLHCQACHSIFIDTREKKR
ncbi:MAG: hypothetical protein N2Z22_11800 [Turneriella sp.]|nr:hypothetical protein [Turneriella sp.]